MLARAVLRIVRWYTLRSPWRKGKGRLVMLTSRLTSHLPDQMVVNSVDGRRLLIQWSSGMAESIYFLGEYEAAVTGLVGQIVQPGDVCLDVGANMGWYTTLLSKLCAPRGMVHAFEPAPAAYSRLEANVKLADCGKNVVLNRTALGSASGQAQLHVFRDLPDGHASLRPMGSLANRRVDVPVASLDDYLDTAGLGDVDFVKVDIEGAELLFFEGAKRLFQQSMPPVFVVEMARATTQPFGYGPNDLLQSMSSAAGFDFFVVDEKSGTLTQIWRFAENSPGAYVLCLPVEQTEGWAMALRQ